MSEINLIDEGGWFVVSLDGGLFIGQGKTSKAALHDAEQGLIDSLANVRQLLDEEEQVKS